MSTGDSDEHGRLARAAGCGLRSAATHGDALLSGPAAGPGAPRTTTGGLRVPGSILGNRVLRKEDPKFLTVGGKYVDDLADEPRLAGAAFVTYVRSTVAHGTITGIDASAALDLPGVIAVLTAEDLDVKAEPAAFNPAV